MLIAEIFGRGVEDNSPAAKAIRDQKLCPFRQTKCTKSGKQDPLAICSLSDGKNAAALCPVRFLEDDLIFKSAAKIAFGDGVEFAVFPEIKILRVGEAGSKKLKKIGKVDFLLGKLESGNVVDIAALEVQATYFSGKALKPAFKSFLKNEKLDASISDRRPDFRSSAQKRLMPQLQLKVPVFRRWGKKFFVVVDSQFFNALPKFPKSSAANSEIVWLSFPLAKTDGNYKISEPEVYGAHWDDVANSLREGVAPEPQEIYEELQTKLSSKRSVRPKLLTT